MDKVILSDLYRYKGHISRFLFWRYFLFIPGFRFSFFLRKAHSTKNFVLKWIYRIFHRHYMIKYGIIIPYKTQIGDGFYIGHFGGIVINENAIIGKNCNIAQNVTIGQTSTRGDHLGGCPIIGDGVWIGTGSVIVGNIKIGNNVLIAPNTYVNFDVPDGSVVISGSKAQIKTKNNPTEGYIVNCI